MNNKLAAMPSRWETFCHSRFDLLRELATTVSQGVRREDTNHPAFCGCIDWHSCVHGLYALLLVSRLTQDPQFADVAEIRFNPQQLEQEFIAVKRGEINHELPYGFAWFLKLAQEREQYFQRRDLLPIALELSHRLERWIFSLSENQILHQISDPAYGNLSWAILNLWRWWKFRENIEGVEQLTQLVRDHILPLDESLPRIQFEKTEEFFSAWLQRLRVLLAILPEVESRNWRETHCRETIVLQPLEHPPTPHSAGLNFSRAWGLWDLFIYSGQRIYRDQYVDHIIQHIDLPQFWKHDYQRHAHWVAQFGIYAIALSFDHSESTDPG